MNTYIFIDGGESFAMEEQYLKWIGTTAIEWNLAPFSLADKKKKWKAELAKKLTEQGNRVYIPDFPNPQNAKYNEWKIFFEVWIERIEIEGTLTLIGHSLGGNFLVKYFGEMNIQNSIFVIPRTPLSRRARLEVPLGCEESIQKTTKSEQILPIVSMTKAKIHIDAVHLVAACISEGDFTAPENYHALRSLGPAVHIWHTEDDDVVPFATAKQLEIELPDAITHFLGSDKGYGHFYPLAVFPEMEGVIFGK